jgi:hypothetical protein
MAVWQFDFHLIPAAAVERYFHSVPLTISDEDYARVAWWSGDDRLHRIEEELSMMLPRRHAWDSGTVALGVEDGDRFDVLREGERIVEIYGRVDVRTFSLSFVNRVVELARRHDLLMLTEDKHVLRPSVKELARAIRRSRSFAYVADPEAFLRRLSSEE